MTEGLMAFLEREGYEDAKELPDGRIAACYRFIFTSAIVVGLDEAGYSDRYCYHTMADARQALDEWDGTGEPEGWHRHTSTGRRREPDGREWINP